MNAAGAHISNRETDASQDPPSAGVDINAAALGTPCRIIYIHLRQRADCNSDVALLLCSIPT